MFTEYTDNLKQKAEEKKEKEEVAQRSSGLIINTNERSLPSFGGGENKESFYFYNPITVAFGKNEFIKTWGERQFEDNWRWSNKRLVNTNSIVVDEALVNATEEELFDPQFYIARIPSEQKAIDSLVKDRNFAYYQLGLIYKDKYKAYNLAKNKLKGVLKSNPEERLILPSKYNLFKIYLLLNLESDALITKNDIITKHLDSRYAKILLNPEIVLGVDENSLESLYVKLYKKFENQEYLEVVSQSDTYITNFDGEAIVPKFEFLKAVSKAKLYGFESYKESLNFIALNYPNSPEGKKAEEMMTNVMPLLSDKEFKDDLKAKHFKVIYQFSNTTKQEVDIFFKNLDEAVKNVTQFRLNISQDFYNQNTVFIVVHGFRSINGAIGFSDLLQYNKHPIDRAYFTISSLNYKIIQIHKNLDEYLKSL